MDEDYCYECAGWYCDDYYIDGEGSLIWKCPECPNWKGEADESD